MKTYTTAQGVDEYIKLCEGYDNSAFEKSILKFLKKGSSLLEIGMGPGNDYKWLSEHYLVTGSDYSEEFIARAKARFPRGHFENLDAISLETNQKFDALYSCKVFQHFELDLIKKSLNRQSEILHRGGLIIHCFWIGDSLFEEGDMRAIYHPKDQLIALIEERFTLLEQTIYEEFEPDDSLFVLAKKP
ncbi:MAG: class I SAM-dependent methyltransferase [bacterium]|nr:class I SAM-dependent methyltransferase [bacterium]